MTQQLTHNDNIVTLPFVFAARQRDPEPARDPDRFGPLLGASPAMQAVYRMIAKVAPTEATVFVIGESGSGKEVAARTVHELSGRASGPLVAMNCGAIPPNLIEAELFGYEKGAFTGASRQHQGFFERAAGGTLFLDEITEMAPEMQVRLLRVLETGHFLRVGGSEDLRADVRVVAATNRQPAAAVATGQLREDLMYRLAVFPVELPPLRKRGDDVELLAGHFLAELNAEAGTCKRFSRTAAEAMRTHLWPGNVRELKNAVHRAYILADGEVDLDFANPAASPAAGAGGERLEFPVGTALADMERQAIFATLNHCRGNKRRCAEILGISLKTLYNRLAAYHAVAAAAAQ
jgi:DNA-binding NtrC family response regulator